MKYSHQIISLRPLQNITLLIKFETPNGFLFNGNHYFVDLKIDEIKIRVEISKIFLSFIIIYPILFLIHTLVNPKYVDFFAISTH